MGNPFVSQCVPVRWSLSTTRKSGHSRLVSHFRERREDLLFVLSAISLALAARQRAKSVLSTGELQACARVYPGERRDAGHIEHLRCTNARNVIESE